MIRMEVGVGDFTYDGIIDFLAQASGKKLTLIKMLPDRLLEGIILKVANWKWLLAKIKPIAESAIKEKAGLDLSFTMLSLTKTVTGLSCMIGVKEFDYTDIFVMARNKLPQSDNPVMSIVPIALTQVDGVIEDDKKTELIAAIINNVPMDTWNDILKQALDKVNAEKGTNLHFALDELKIHKDNN